MHDDAHSKSNEANEARLPLRVLLFPRFLCSMLLLQLSPLPLLQQQQQQQQLQSLPTLLLLPKNGILVMYDGYECDVVADRAAKI